MKLRIRNKYIGNNAFSITVNNISHIVNRKNKFADFIISESENCSVTIRQIIERKNILLEVFLFLITMLFQGIANIVFMNTKLPSYEKINPYIANIDFEVKLKEDEEITFNYLDGKYSKTKGAIKPQFECEQVEKIKVNYEKIKVPFINIFLLIVKKIISCCLIGEIIFLVLIFFSIRNSNFLGLIICAAILVFFIIFQIILIIKEYKRMNKIFQAIN